MELDKEIAEVQVLIVFLDRLTREIQSQMPKASKVLYQISGKLEKYRDYLYGEWGDSLYEVADNNQDEQQEEF